MLDRSAVMTMFAYNRWANQRTLDAVSRLDDEQLLRPVGGSFGSVRDTLVHLLSADWIWLERCLGRSPKSLLAASEFPDFASLRARWDEVARGQQLFCEALAPEDLGRMVTYVNTKGETWSYPLSQVLWQVVNHGTYHRGQITTLLRHLGATPAATDFLVFVDEGSGRG